MSSNILITGATGGVGQLATAQLISQGHRVRLLVRNEAKARAMFGPTPGANRDLCLGDIRDPATLGPATDGITHILCCTGTTAFPSPRWDLISDSEGIAQLLDWGRVFLDPAARQTLVRNSPEQVDAIGVSNLVAAAPRDLQRFVFVSSCGIERKDKPPFSLLNAFGVLDAKQRGEQAIIQSGLPYSIIRPARLIDGPYTSADLNTLLKATTSGKLGVQLGTGDSLVGQTSRIDVAAACVAALNSAAARDRIFEIINSGSRPEAIDWEALFAALT
jgi:uncharacterized protein YbjT (DUF2867 family)